MDFISGLILSYSHFFSWPEIVATVTSPANWAVIGTLIVLEGLLSADNALVLAIMVKHLPKEQQRKALYYGILGAYAFRFLAIGLGTFLVKIWWVKLVGAAYLLYLAGSHFFGKSEEDDVDENKVAGMGFWRTVLAVEMMDVAFSMDSILAAFGISDQTWVLFLGGLLGVAMMRGVAQVFLKLIEKIPELETTAYILIGIIGFKMLGASFDVHVNEWIFFGTLVSVFLGTILLSYMRKAQMAKQ